MTDKMRLLHRLVVTSGVFLAAAAMVATGCDNVVDDCNREHTCPSSASAGGGGTVGSAGTGGGDASTEDGGAGSNCDPTISSGISSVDVSCGVYVWNNTVALPYLGTPDNPYSTLAA
ncbi:MAG: hypothetical protein ACMG6S_06205, partial [Byssovorax sp.]